MDGIYDDLENYTDGEVIEELTNENKELKFKLNEYTMEIEKLQKEYDKLSSEYAKIQLNYSSLLKTAKAEVERKTQIIASLNMEKDLLVLSSIQNSNKDIFSLRRNLAQKKFNNRKQWNDETASIEASKKDVQDVKKQEQERPKNDENRVPSVDTVTSGNVSEDMNKNDHVDNKISKLDSFDKNNESKEIVAKGKKALSLKHRRKSMPVLNKIPASSDEEYEGDCSEELKREKLPREEKSKKYFDRHKISETSGIDEKYSSYHESSRETYYKGKSHRSIEKIKNLRDKFRYRKHYSPDKIRRTTKEYQTDERQDIFRHNRVLVSPPRGYESLRMLRDRRLNRESDKSYEERHSRRDEFYDERLKRKDFRDNKYVQRDDYHMDRHKQRENRREEEKHTRKYDSYEEIPRPRSRSYDRHRSDSLDERHRRKGDVVDEKLKSRDSSEKRTRKYDSQEKIPRPDSRSDERHRSDSLDERSKRKGDIVDEQPKSRENSEKRKNKYESSDELQRRYPRSYDNHRSETLDKRHRLKGDVIDEKLKSRDNSEKRTPKYDSHDEILRSDSRSDNRHRSGSLDERQKLKEDVIDEKLKSRDNTEKCTGNFDSHEEIPRADSRFDDRQRSDSLDARNRLKGDDVDERLKYRDRFDKDSCKYDSHEETQRRDFRSDVRFKSDSIDARDRLKGDTVDEKLKFSESSDKHLRKYDTHEETPRSDIGSNDRPRHDSLDKSHVLKIDVVDEKQKSRDSTDKHTHKYDSNEGTQIRSHHEEKLKHDIVDNTPISTDDDAKPKQKEENIRKRNGDRLREEIQKETLVENNTRRRIRPIKICDLDEPSCKRARLGPFKKSIEVDKFPEEPLPGEKRLVPKLVGNLQQTSCQSPDEPHHDTQRTPTVSTCEQPKEIMTASATALEDPRLSSKKYYKTIEDDKIVLSTITGRNVNLVSINISTWDIPRVEMPEALQEPPRYTVEMVRDMYMDIDNPVSNMSLESGEINSESSDVRMVDYLSKNFYQDYENERINQIEARVEKAKHKRDIRVELDINQEPSISKKVEQNEPRFPPMKHTVSRPSKPELITKSTPNPLGILLQQLQSVCNVDTTTKLTEAKLDVDATYGADDDSKNKNDIRKEDKPNETRRKVSTQELVEGDLALSDETSDNIFVRKQTKKVKGSVGDKDKSAKTIEKFTDKKPKKPKNSSKLKPKAEEKSGEVPKETIEDQSVKKIKKKSVSKRPSSAKDSLKAVDIETITEKKTKSKKMKSPKDDTNNENKVKFTELFGSNSCSLITPEDLGVASSPKSKTKKYVPIFEDAQDAVDVNVTATNKTDMVEQSVTSTKMEKPKVVEETPNSLICKIDIPTKVNIAVPKTAPTMEVSDVEVTKEPDVVKTVVISTGVQLTIKQPETENDSANQNVTVVENAKEIVQDINIPIALATSTPHKNLLLQLEANVECSRSCNSSEVQVSSADRSSMSSEAQNDDDAPDVRIFMKRRRRVRK